MAQINLVQDIRESLLKFDELIKVSYGRSLDNAFASAKLEIDNYLVCIDPPTYSGSVIDVNETASVSISWLKLDNADSEADEELNEAAEESIESIVNDCRNKVLQWLGVFGDDYYNRYTINNWTGFNAFKVKHMVSGFVITLSISYKRSC